MAKVRTSKPFVEELPALLDDRGMSLRSLARAVGIGDDHLSRVLRGARAKKPSADLARRVAVVLELPEDYFPEARLEFVIEELVRQPALLDRVYDQLQRAAAPAQAPSVRRKRRS